MTHLPNSADSIVEDLENELDSTLVLLGRYQDIGREDVPLSVVKRLSDGEPPVRVWREYRSLSQKQLAELACQPVTVISGLESGDQSCPLAVLAAVARALKVELDDLVPWNQGA